MNLRFTVGQSIIVFLVVIFLCTLVGSLINSAVMLMGMSTQTLRVMTVIQDCFVFILPAVITAYMICGLPARFLGIDRSFSIIQLLLAVAVMIASMPAMNFLVKLNADITLPESMGALEEWMRSSEDRAQEMVDMMLGGCTVGSLIVSILLVGVMAGLSEELFFRGALQNIIGSSRLSHHVAIWLTAFIFSAFHLQFYGFFPRLVMGAYFGYLLYWSKSLWLPILIHTFNNSIVISVNWHEKLTDLPSGSSESFNEWGANSPTLILASLILTAFLILRLQKTSTKPTDTAITE